MSIKNKWFSGNKEIFIFMFCMSKKKQKSLEVNKTMKSIESFDRKKGKRIWFWYELTYFAWICTSTAWTIWFHMAWFFLGTLMSGWEILIEVVWVDIKGNWLWEW